MINHEILGVSPSAQPEYFLCCSPFLLMGEVGHSTGPCSCCQAFVAENHHNLRRFFITSPCWIRPCPILKVSQGCFQVWASIMDAILWPYAGNFWSDKYRSVPQRVTWLDFHDVQTLSSCWVVNRPLIALHEQVVVWYWWIFIDR